MERRIYWNSQKTRTDPTRTGVTSEGTCWTMIIFVRHSSVKLPNLCPWVSPQQQSSTRGEQKLFRSPPAPRSWTNSCRVCTVRKSTSIITADVVYVWHVWPMRIGLAVLCRWNWDGLHHRDVWRVSNREDPIVPHTCCHLSGRVKTKFHRNALP